jgi:hypothetical protein
LCILLVANHDAHAAEIEGYTDLPSGFGVEKVWINTPGDPGTFTHLAVLYHGNQRLGQIATGITPYAFRGEWTFDMSRVCSIAPAGRFAAYIDLQSGELRLFNTLTAASSRLAGKFAIPVRKFAWDLKDGYLLVYFEKEALPRKFPLK